MSDRKLSILSAILTVVFLLILGILFFFVQLVLLNGVSEQQGGIALGISLLCQGLIILLAGFFAAWLSRLLVIKWGWNRTLVVIVTVLLGVLAGVLALFFSILVSIPLAGMG